MCNENTFLGRNKNTFCKSEIFYAGCLKLLYNVTTKVISNLKHL